MLISETVLHMRLSKITKERLYKILPGISFVSKCCDLIIDTDVLFTPHTLVLVFSVLVFDGGNGDI